MKQSSQSLSQANGADVAAERVRESVSALMDGEAQALELRRLLSAEHSAIVSESWQRYHLVRDVLQGESSTRAFRHLDISQQVSAAIAKETTPASAGRYNSWLKPVAGFAVAASVAVGVVIGVQGLNQAVPGAAAPTGAAVSIASNRVYPISGSSLQASAGSGAHAVVNYSSPQLPSALINGALTSRAAMTRTAAEQEEAQRHLEKYMLIHTENAALNTGQGVMPFARVASFESE